MLEIREQDEIFHFFKFITMFKVPRYLLRLVCTVENGNNGGPSRAAVGQMRATRAAAQTRVTSTSRCCWLGARPTHATRSAVKVS
uniref:Uncharacterized protein n=1 Tax=Trichogramma kaykai TaxID=54128 RepID=A0ABD2W6S3_9HYME